jgi:hypothetical protein
MGYNWQGISGVVAEKVFELTYLWFLIERNRGRAVKALVLQLSRRLY